MSDLVDTLIEADQWEKASLEELADLAAAATLTHLGMDPEAFEISLLGCDDARIAVLNTEFRGKPVPTNVLSWPSEERAAEDAGEAPELPAPDKSGMLVELGDIAIAYETCAREAADAGRPMRHHVLHLLCHGVLHLLGYDHIDEKDATLMEGTEVAILATLGVPDPY
ncbi:rRNA maturation RNase YbeY [Pseudogemmobacter sp. W21_MBD1_M6]|uniref:rRNA maturation RNase YbeY n=1 Tax=Pseudogemmobacter sp. W21_MBD1_M6 TaxID=3240271 RepID=UPI003F9EAA93